MKNLYNGHSIKILGNRFLFFSDKLGENRDYAEAVSTYDASVDIENLSSETIEELVQKRGFEDMASLKNRDNLEKYLENLVEDFKVRANEQYMSLHGLGSSENTDSLKGVVTERDLILDALKKGGVIYTYNNDWKFNDSSGELGKVHISTEINYPKSKDIQKISFEEDSDALRG